MNNVLDEPKAGEGTQTRPTSAATCCGHDVEEVTKRIEKGVKEMKANVSAKLEDGKVAAERLLKRSRYAFEDGIEETTRGVKRHPFGALAIAFAAGAAVAFLVPRAARR